MGIILTEPEFEHLADARQRALPRLREWGIESAEAVGTLVMADNPAALAHMVETHPEMDFALPAEFRSALATGAAAGHEVVEMGPGRLLLLSREGGDGARIPQWTCHL
jgi:hypothetical protein